GNLQFLGRRDQQVKLRGFRIELGEIEAALKQHQAIRDAVVMTREDRPGNKRLVAYVVAARERVVTAGELRAFLMDKLPDHMVPAAFLTLEAPPRTSSGKVERRELPAPAPESFEAERARHVPPRDGVEEQLEAIFCEALGLDRVGVHDDFFALGGDSLL